MKTLKKDGCVIKVLETPNEARTLLAALKKNQKPDSPYALDFETTALRPSASMDDYVRITSIAVNATTSYVVDHWLCGSFGSMVDEILDAGPYYVFNVNFEGRWFDWEVDHPAKISRALLDVAHMRRSVMGGGPWSLLTMAKADLNVKLDKTEQNSSWGSEELSNSQYFYAGYDAIVTKRLGNKWRVEMTPERWNGFWVINEAWRAVNECEDTGLLLDVDWHRGLIAMWTKRRIAAEKAIRKLVNTQQVANIRSKKQISDFLKNLLDADSIRDWPKTDKTQQLKTDRNILRSMSYIAPYPLSRFLAALMVFNRADKYLGTYGETLLTKQLLSEDGRIHGRLNMAAAITGRFSSSNPNQQNFPRAPNFRRSFRAGKGKKKVIADYSGVEIRVLAELSGDKILLHDAIYDDVHTQSAIAIYGITNIEDFKKRLKDKDPRAKEMRARAKGFTFQLLYGAAAPALAIVLRCSIAQAAEAIDAWARRYSKAYAYRQYMFEKMRHDGFLPCASGRTIFVKRQERTMPVAANYPIQGSAADVMYRAMTRVQEEIENSGIDAVMMTSVHDELLLLADEDCAEEAAEILKIGMTKGWLDIFPGSNVDNLCDVGIGDYWSDKA